MPHYAIKREDLKLGTRIISMAEPGKGLVFELIHIQPVGYDRRNGRNVSFTEYDFREVESGRHRHGFALNYINRYFALTPEQHRAVTEAAAGAGIHVID